MVVNTRNSAFIELSWHWANIGILPSHVICWSPSGHTWENSGLTLLKYLSPIPSPRLFDG